MTKTDHPDELPVIRAHYELMLQLQSHIAKFPRDLRFSVGRRIEDLLHDVLASLIRAKYGRSRRELLADVNVNLEILRFELRFAKDSRCLSNRHYGTLSGRLLEIGRQVGGWLKS